MSNFFSPVGNSAGFTDSNGNPLSGALLFTYLAGSTTKKTTYKDIAGAASHTNPIVLDSNGRPPNPIWLIGSSTYKFVLAPSTDTDPPTSSIYTWNDIAGINDAVASGQDQWISGPAPTFVDANTFTVVGDQTSTFHVGRRVKLTVSAGTVYGYISVTAFTTLTTIDVVLDSGALNSGLSAVSYALLTSTNQSFPNRVATTDTAQTVTAAKTHTGSLTMSGSTGTLIMSGASLNMAEGSDVASAATADIWSTTGNTVHVTGTTTITSFGTAPQAGAWRRVIFDGALTLTHGANLNLPGAANITTAAGDSCIVYADTTSQLDIFDYTRASGLPVVASTQGITKLNSGTGTAATHDIVMTSYTAYTNKILVINYLPSTNGTDVYLRTSTNGGSTFDATASDYDGTVNAGGDAIRLNGGTTISNASDATQFSTTIHMYDMASARRIGFLWRAVFQDTGGVFATITGQARRALGQDTDALRILSSSGNSTLTWALYGYN